MKQFIEDIKKIYETERSILFLMGMNLVLSIGLIIFSFINLDTGSVVTKVGYGDIGGYRDGSWVDLLAFPLLGLVLGVLHNFLALVVFRRRGTGMTKFFLITTTAIIVGTFIALARLLEEG